MFFSKNLVQEAYMGRLSELLDHLLGGSVFLLEATPGLLWFAVMVLQDNF